MNNYLERLKEIAPAILAEELNYEELTKALSNYRELLLEITALNLDSQENVSNIALKDGLAIGPSWAARCLDDVLRTKRFIRGVYLAVSSVISKDKPVEILYSGTGPFATLVLPLLTQFSPQQIQFTLVEVNPISYNYVLQVFKAFNAEAYIRKSYLEDATKLNLPNSKSIDVIIVECLQHALAREPQVAITTNYMKQCREDVILIPEAISLNLTLMNRSREMDSFFAEGKKVERIDKEVFLLDKSNASDFNLTEAQEVKLSEMETHFSEEELQNMTVLTVTTNIKVFQNEILSNYDSGLTIPFTHSEIKEGDNNLVISTYYKIGDEPSLQIKKSQSI